MDKLSEMVFFAIGEASMCWHPRPAGIFDASHAKCIGEELIAYINASTTPNKKEEGVQ